MFFSTVVVVSQTPRERVKMEKIDKTLSLLNFCKNVSYSAKIYFDLSIQFVKTFSFTTDLRGYNPVTTANTYSLHTHSGVNGGWFRM